MSRKTAKIWNYTGNHSSGTSHIHRNPHNFTLDEIQAVQRAAEEAEGYGGFNAVDFDILTREEIQSLEVIRHKGDSFGYPATVKAASSVWEKAKNLIK